MLGLAILFGFNLLGVLIEKGLHVPVPANVIGLILFAAALFAKIIKLEWVERSAEFMLRHMMLFFAPFVVGTIAFFPVIKENGLAVVVSLVGSTLVVMTVTGAVSAWIGSRTSSKTASPNQPSAERSLAE